MRIEGRLNLPNEGFVSGSKFLAASAGAVRQHGIGRRNFIVVLQGRLETWRSKTLTRQLGSCGTDVSFRHPVSIHAPWNLSCGSHVRVGEFSVLRAQAGITIGSQVLIAAHVILTTRSHPQELPRWGEVLDQPIVVEDDVFIGSAAVILPGVRIGEGSIVGAGAVVTRDVDPFVFVAGVPARVVHPIARGNAHAPRGWPTVSPNND